MTDGVPGEDDDAELLRRHVDGDPDAFSLLVRRHQDRMWAVALRTTGNPEEAADAVQEAMVKAFRSADRFRGDAAVTTWLHRIVVNSCLDLLRRKKARPAVPLEADDHVGALADRPSGDAALQREQRLDVLAALRELPEEQRAAIVLVDMEGYPVAEVAAMLDCAPGTVKSRCARGRERLAPLLAAWRNQQPDPSVPSETTNIRGTQTRSDPAPGGEPHAR
ncbi:RNA polymerase sigma factor SigM [Solicola gregarius]|uniref:RNA polymerase sigma factor SigM n=1 Tax=Solicola gregarius TaxID=2908642 RepID=A0AA46TL92_9ACTN|nr:RNA polymerase sigma factor SigM [Solicola gregarius]UYM07356.1 RNA polymerase sigma factor SigM [Solicola gregarius]